MNPPGISIISQAPLWRYGTDVWHITQQIDKYSHTIEALGGYWSCQFTIRANAHKVNDWIQHGLGRHIEVFDDSMSNIWEGFVDKISVNYGPLSVTRGPLMDVSNSVNAVFAPIEFDEDGGQVIGSRSRTGFYTNNDSVALWATIPTTLMTGSMTFEDSQTLRYTYLVNHMRPRTSKEFRSDASRDTSVTVDCLGYVHWLNWAYNQTTTNGEIDADAKIIDVLGDSPNATWLAYDTHHIDSNTLQVAALENDDNLAWNVIKDIAAKGDATYNRWLFGVYENLNAYYYQAPETVYYNQRLSQSRSIVETTASDEVYPWKVRPGKWIMFPDFLVGQAAGYDLRDDPRAMFIESVKFTAPDGLIMRGGDVDTVEAVLGQMGLSGVGS